MLKILMSKKAMCECYENMGESENINSSLFAGSVKEDEDVICWTENFPCFYKMNRLCE